jgi:hypothetical protein
MPMLEISKGLTADSAAECAAQFTDCPHLLTQHIVAKDHGLSLKVSQTQETSADCNPHSGERRFDVQAGLIDASTASSHHQSGKHTDSIFDASGTSHPQSNDLTQGVIDASTLSHPQSNNLTHCVIDASTLSQPQSNDLTHGVIDASTLSQPQSSNHVDDVSNSSTPSLQHVQESASCATVDQITLNSISQRETIALQQQTELGQEGAANFGEQSGPHVHSIEIQLSESCIEDITVGHAHSNKIRFSENCIDDTTVMQANSNEFQSSEGPIKDTTVMNVQSSEQIPYSGKSTDKRAEKREAASKESYVLMHGSFNSRVEQQHLDDITSAKESSFSHSVANKRAQSHESSNEEFLQLQANLVKLQGEMSHLNTQIQILHQENAEFRTKDLQSRVDEVEMKQLNKDLGANLWKSNKAVEDLETQLAQVQSEAVQLKEDNVLLSGETIRSAHYCFSKEVRK